MNNSTNIKKLLIDIDEVICSSNFLSLLNEFLGTHYVISDFSTYFIDSIIGSDQKITDFYSFLREKSLYENAKFLPKCKSTVKKLSKAYDIYICSSCAMFGNYDNSGPFFAEKYNFLIKNFPYLNPENFIFTGAKNMINADVIIDDYIKNLDNNIQLKLMMTAYHNKNIPDDELAQKHITRVNSWDDIAKILL